MAAQNSFRVEFQMSEADVFRYRMVYGQFYWRLPFVLVAIACGNYQPILDVMKHRASASDQQFVEKWLPALMLGAVALFCLVWLYYRWDTKRTWRKIPGAAERRTVEISPEGVYFSSPMEESDVKWSAYTKVSSSREFICCYIGSAVAGIIPRRAFSSPQEAEAFFRAAKEWHAAATGRPHR